MKKVAILLIDTYRVTVSPFLFTIFGRGCRHKIECSVYTQDAISKYGAIKGLKKGLKRLAHCHPF